jgi:uncharacterized membrane-anchored protein
MIAARNWMWPLLGAVALVQSAMVFEMVYQRHRLLKSGKEVTLAVRPLDPRDLFRGDYVILGYDISRLTKSATESDPEFSGFVKGGDAFVTLSPAPGGAWTTAHVGTSYPAKVDPGDIVIKGTIVSTWQSKEPAEVAASVRYGIEQYFVPEGAGQDLQAKVRDHKIEAIIAVAADGTAALKGLVIDGERHEDPPLL